MLKDYKESKRNESDAKDEEGLEIVDLDGQKEENSKYETDDQGQNTIHKDPEEEEYDTRIKKHSKNDTPDVDPSYTNPFASKGASEIKNRQLNN